MAFGIDDAIAAGLQVLNKFVPDPALKAKAESELRANVQALQVAQLNAETEQAKAQNQTNTEEAKSTNIFVSGWRPFIGWVCGSGLAFQFIIAPIATWATMLYGKQVTFPALDMGTLITLLAGMLGLGAMRTTEKLKGIGR